MPEPSLSAHASQSTSQSSSTRPEESQTVAQSLWDRAYDLLREKDAGLVNKYEKLLSRHLKGTGSVPATSRITAASSGDAPKPSRPNDGPSDRAEESLDETDDDIDNANLQNRRAQLDEIIKDGLDRVEQNKIKYTIAGHEFDLQHQIAQTVGLIRGLKDFIGEAVKASPEASLAWAGVCIILPILTNPDTAEQANRDGFTYVVSRMHFYTELERLLWPANLEQAGQLKKAFEDHILDLYQHILDFQLRSVLRFYRSRLRNTGRDLIQHEDWKGMLTTINDKEAIVRDDSERINTVSSRQYLDGLSDKAKASLDTVQELLCTVRQQLQVSMEHRDISAKQFQTTEKQLVVLKRIAEYVFPHFLVSISHLLTAKQ